MPADSKDAIRWSSADPRNITATWEGFALQVRAIKHGTAWEAIVEGPGFKKISEHVSKDAAKQRAAKTVRSQPKIAPSVDAGVI